MADGGCSRKNKPVVCRRTRIIQRSGTPNYYSIRVEGSHGAVNRSVVNCSLSSNPSRYWPPLRSSLGLCLSWNRSEVMRSITVRLITSGCAALVAFAAAAASCQSAVTGATTDQSAASGPTTGLRTCPDQPTSPRFE